MQIDIWRIDMEHKLRRYMNLKEKRGLIFSSLFAMLLSLSIFVGNKIDKDEGVFLNFEYKDIFLFVAYVIGLTIVGLFLLRFFSSQEEQRNHVNEFNLRIWMIRSVIIFLCWFPYLLAFYPGNMSVDSNWSIQQILGNSPLNNTHPILYTLTVGIFVRLGMWIKDLEFGIALYSVAQMAILSIVLGGITEWFKKKGWSKWAVRLSNGFFALNPLIAMYSITMWKDIFFSAWLFLLSIFLYDVIKNKKEIICTFKVKISLAVLSLLIAFGRNNGTYILILILICLLLYYRKYYKKILPLFVGIIAVIYIIQGPIYNYIGIEKGNLAESLAVPLQQIAYTVKNDGKITEEQEKFLDKIIPLEKMKKVYISYSSNSVKFDDEFDNEFLEKNVGEFLKVWTEMLPYNFMDYVKAYLLHTHGYWHIGTNDWRCVYGVVNCPEIQQTDLIERAVHVDIKPIVEEIVEFKSNIIPGVNWVYSIAASVWLIVFACVYCIYIKKMRIIVSMLPLIGNWITIMIATPIYCEFRYMFSFHIALPFIFFLLFKADKEEILV